MKLLLVNPPVTYQTPWLQVTEPLGLLYLASYVREFSGHTVGILDCLANKLVTKIGENLYWYGLTRETLFREIEKFQPDIIGITCMFSKKKDDFLQLAQNIRHRFPGVILVAGGTYPSLFPVETIDTGLIDYCVIGEGERTLVDLLNALSDLPDSLPAIEGLAFLKGDEVVVTPKTAYIKELDQIPFPARDLIDYEAYVARKSVLHGLGLKRSASILTSRSCPNRCNFCSMYKIHGQRWRCRSPENVVEEIIHLKQRYNVKDLFIMDDNFTFSKKRIMEICETIRRSNIRIRWNTPNGISINTLDKEVLSAMKAAGCKGICVAIESGDEELRNKVIGKRLTDQKIETVIKIASEIGIFVTAFYIIGMPGETEEKFEKTLQQLKTLPLNGAAAAFANPLPGTKLYEDCINNNWTILDSDENHRNILYKPFIVTNDFSESDLMTREKRFYRTFVRAKLFTLMKDTILLRNGLLYPPFLMRILRDRLLRK
jgi:magnesium-protoporphyrin IX monomethyl ester (oxidative) cyclase